MKTVLKKQTNGFWKFRKRRASIGVVFDPRIEDGTCPSVSLEIAF